MRALPRQNQQWLSGLFLILLRYSVEHQWPVRIWVAVLAREFCTLSRQDFFGGGGGTSLIPWFAGQPC